jgi:hypothetical protein
MNRFCFSALAFLACTTALPIAARAQTSPNLLLNGDAEIGRCTDDKGAATTVPGWTVTQGYPTLFCKTAGGKPVSGNAAIWNGPYGPSTLIQMVEIPEQTGDVTYRLSGKFGSVGGKGTAALSAEFRDGAGKALGSSNSLTGTLPAGTRSIRVALRFTGKGGLADDLSLTVSAAVTPATLAPPKSEVPRFDHVFIIMMENTDYGQIIGNVTDAPYVNSLLSQGTLLRNFQANYHPSSLSGLTRSAGMV